MFGARNVTEIESLRELLDGELSIDSGERARVIRAAMRADPAATHALMDRAYVQGLRQAYTQTGHSGLADLAGIGAAELDTIGELGGAVARLNQALTLVAGDPAEVSEILSLRAVYQALALDGDAARSSLKQARSALPENSGPELAETWRVLNAAVACIQLRFDDLPAATKMITEAQEREHDSLASAFMVYLIAALAVVGDSANVRAWAEALLGYTEALEHQARQADARIALSSLRIRSGSDVELGEIDELAVSKFNNTALWRTRVLAVYRALIRGDRVGAAEALQQLGRIRPIINAAYSHGSEGFDLVIQALLEPGAVVEIAPPGVVTSPSIGGTLAGAEATAIAGPLTRAADWLTWLQETLPERVVTSLEWPACRKRIEGLLLLRVGDQREAVVRLQEAVHCCEQRGDVVQAGIGRIQLAEALSRRSGMLHPAFREQLMSEADPEGLRSLGVDPIPFAYATSRTFVPHESEPERGGLTAREAQVLGRLARGDSYNEIAEELGINARTVGVHASHCYEKLGVRNRVEAVQTAVRLGIVSS